jgi:TonB family protein
VLLIPPQRPRNLSTRDVILRLSVDERGKVREVVVVTPTGNRGYDDSLKRTAMAWEFSPAREQDTNRPVAAKLDVTVTI